MKKLVTLFLAAGMLLTSVGMASAVEFKPSGNIDMGAMWGRNLQTFPFMSPDDVADNFGFTTFTPHKSLYRMNYSLNLDIIASEQLSGRIGFGHDLGSDGHTFGTSTPWQVRVTSIYFDWYVPNTPLEVRMGRWTPSAPAFAVGTINPMGASDGIRLQAKINDNVTVMGMWLRRGNTAEITDQFYGNHAADQFHIQVPVTLDGFRFTPWANYIRIGERSNFLVNSVETKTTYYDSVAPLPYTGPSVTFRTYGSTYTGGYLPLKGAVLAATHNPSQLATKGVPGTELAGGGTPPVYNQAGFVDPGQSRGWFAGIGGSITKFTPFTFAFDFAYSNFKATPTWDATNATSNKWATPAYAGDEFMNRSGWFLAGSAAYKTDWGTPTLKGWYSTGDDDDIYNGSERPVNPGSGSTAIGSLFGQGDLRLGHDAGLGITGTWGLSAQWVGASFVKDLTHTLAFTYVHGNNDPLMASYIPNPGKVSDGFNAGGYLTKDDSVWALELRNSYKVYKELTMVFDMFYIWQKFDETTWSTVWSAAPTTAQITAGADPNGDFVYRNAAETMDFSNAWGIGLSFRYAF